VRLPISAVDAISPAFHHARQQLFQPFRAGQWLRLAFVGLLAGEVSSGGGCNSFQVPQIHDGGQKFAAAPLANANPLLYAGLIGLLVVLGVIFWFLLMYANSVMRFVLFDSVLAKECHIRQSWNRRQRPGFRYLGWQLLLLAVMIGVSTILVGIPAAIAFGLGWLNNPRQHIVPLVLGGIVLFFVFFAFIISLLVVAVLTKDFVVPQMALEDISVFEGWRRLWAGIKTEKGGYAAYIGMKVLMALGAAMVLGIVSFIVILLVAIPLGGIGVIAVITGKTAGLTWNAYTITLAVIGGAFCLAVLFYVLALISVPVIVFFPAYAIHFFASRYRPLDAVLHPAPQAPPLSELPPLPPPTPPEPPPLPPEFNPSPA
jgi:hypothetical protein